MPQKINNKQIVIVSVIRDRYNLLLLLYVLQICSSIV